MKLFTICVLLMVVLASFSVSAMEESGRYKRNAFWGGRGGWGGGFRGGFGGGFGRRGGWGGGFRRGGWGGGYHG